MLQLDRRQFLRVLTASSGVLTTGTSLSCAVGPNGTDELSLLTFSELREQFVSGKISPVEVTENYIKRYLNLNPIINACVQEDFEGARKRAKEWENELTEWRARKSSEDALPLLFGLLFGVKDMFDVQRHPTSQGSPKLIKRIATNDAEIVKRFRERGGYPIVKTNMPFMGMSFTDTANSVFNTTNNPRNLDRVPGGSSGGSAAAVAAGLSWIDIGADAGGSIRVPSALCGVYGLRPRPSMNASLLAGIYPPVPSAEFGAYFLTVGPIARSVSDLELVLPLFVDPKSVNDLREDPTSKMRIAFFTEWGGGYATPTTAIQDAINSAAEALRTFGHEVKQNQPNFLRGANTAEVALSSVFASDLADDHRDQLIEHGIFDKDRTMRDVNVLFSGYAGRRLGGTTGMKRHLKRLPIWRKNMTDFMDEIDALVMPLVSDVAPKHGTTYSDDNIVEGFGTYPLAASITDNLAAGGLPYTYSADGLPHSLQVIAKSEKTVLRVMSLLEQVSGGFRPPTAVYNEATENK